MTEKYTKIQGFGTIRNNTALKPIVKYINTSPWFWNHSKQHSSKTENYQEFSKK